MRAGQIDTALVAGVNISLRPSVAKQFQLLNMLGPDGYCKVWDRRANGYARSEGCVALLLQRASVAKRQYAELVHIATNTDGYKEMGITFPSTESQIKLMKNTYEEAGIDPLEVKYMEAHGTGTQAGDPQEGNAIAEALCVGREEPLLVGAVKSCIGHNEVNLESI